MSENFTGAREAERRLARDWQRTAQAAERGLAEDLRRMSEHYFHGATEEARANENRLYDAAAEMTPRKSEPTKITIILGEAT